MSSEAKLFVGGPLDGQVIAVESGTQSWTIWTKADPCGQVCVAYSLDYGDDDAHYVGTGLSVQSCLQMVMDFRVCRGNGIEWTPRNEIGQHP